MQKEKIAGKEALWERFFNWQSDQGWTWGPFLPLRPARDVPMWPWVWVRLFAALSLAGSLLVVLVGGVCILGPKVAAQQHWAVPAGAAETLGTLAAMGADRTLQALGIGLVLCLPLLFFGFCWPFHAAWNRRATRLSQAEAPKAQGKEQPGSVWPPAPNKP